MDGCAEDKLDILQNRVARSRFASPNSFTASRARADGRPAHRLLETEAVSKFVKRVTPWIDDATTTGRHGQYRQCASPTSPHIPGFVLK
jgi:hypothetical protein